VVRMTNPNRTFMMLSFLKSGVAVGTVGSSSASCDGEGKISQTIVQLDLWAAEHLLHPSGWNQPDEAGVRARVPVRAGWT
jgi:hypothetical protein